MASLVFPTLVREQILEQHGELRTLVRRAIEHAVPDRADGPEPDPTELRAVVVELCERVRAHLVFEADALRPVFAVLDSWGPERIRDLNTEHIRQGQDLDALLAKVDAQENIHQLSVAVSMLGADLLKDMDAEEDGCLRASLLSAVSLTIERR